jgi:dolichyl-phosphate-mannose--protein O-mannosyl transferase
LHIVNWTIAGLLVLALFILAAGFINRRRGKNSVDGAKFFIGVWFFAALFNFYNGWAAHGIPFVNEVAAFVPIFGIPAAAAWLLARQSRS